MQKRFQYWTRNGVAWTTWFKVLDTTTQEPWQLKNKLRNEYREEE